MNSFMDKPNVIYKCSGPHSALCPNCEYYYGVNVMCFFKNTLTDLNSFTRSVKKHFDKNELHLTTTDRGKCGLVKTMIGRKLS